MKNVVVLISLIIFCVVLLGACSYRKSAGVTKIAKKYAAYLAEGNLEGLMEYYADSVQLTDPMWGGSDLYLKNQIREMYGELFSKSGGWTYIIEAVASDGPKGMIMLKGVARDARQRSMDFNSNLTLREGKIVAQKDLVVYPAEDLEFSDRFKPFYKESSEEMEKETRQFSDAYQGYLEAWRLKDAERFVSHYQDTVTYIDPSWGSVDHFSRAELTEMFSAFFNPKYGYDFDIKTVNPDYTNRVLMLQVAIVNPDGTTTQYAGWFRFENGKIEEQIDFTTYLVKDQLEAPRFKEYFEKEGLSVQPVPEKNGN